MNIIKPILMSALIAAGTNAFAQEFYTDSAFAAAVANGTRTTTGLPGDNYKTNFAHYNITADFRTIEGHLYGSETIKYDYNCGQGDLNSIVINLYRNVYKDGVTKYRHVDSRDKFKGVEIEKVQLVDNGRYTDLNITEYGTQIEAALPAPLTKGNSITLYIKWNTKIAAFSHIRGGKYNNDTWFVPYFYPQIAVYDDIYGWDRVQHSGNEEFYFENANYDVALTTDQYTAVWATGVLQNPEKVYSPTVLKKYREALSSGNITDIITKQDLEKHAVKSEKNIWKFHADSVPDFVFSCSASSQWTAKNFELAPGKRTTAAAVYRNPIFRDNVDLAETTITYLSHNRPGVTYPYPWMTLFEGSGGMEFPMMVNEDLDVLWDDMIFTTSHEITHTYFPFLTGINQNTYGFIDEGLTMFVPEYLQDSLTIIKNAISRSASYVSTVLGTTIERPVITPSYKMRELWPFTMSSYYTPQIGYNILEGILGRELMDKALHQFTSAWSRKHAHPYDFFYTLEAMSGKDLKFFYQNWFANTGSADLGIKNVYRDDTTNYIIIENFGEKYVPALIKITYMNEATETIYQSAEMWRNGDRTCTIALPGPQISQVELLTEYIPDNDSQNNNFYIQK
ncbi:MAG: hypothetical protein IKQ70_00335 [Bacteroidales bacterium]|nr:hypothetical protein [Bacteroidales bacterium]